MNCRRARGRLSEYLDGDLAPRRRRRLEAHLVACPACRTELEGLRRLAAELAALPEERPPDCIRSGALALFREETRRRRAARPERLGWWPARRRLSRGMVAATAALVVVLSFAVYRHFESAGLLGPERAFLEAPGTTAPAAQPAEGLFDLREQTGTGSAAARLDLDRAPAADRPADRSEVAKEKAAAPEAQPATAAAARRERAAGFDPAAEQPPAPARGALAVSEKKAAEESEADRWGGEDRSMPSGSPPAAARSPLRPVMGQLSAVTDGRQSATGWTWFLPEGPDLEPLAVAGAVAAPVLMRRTEPAPPGPPDPGPGCVFLEIVIDARGRVAGARVLQGLCPACDEGALAALRSWEFDPARLDGAPVDVFQIVTVCYPLDGAGPTPAAAEGP